LIEIVREIADDLLSDIAASWSGLESEIHKTLSISGRGRDRKHKQLQLRSPEVATAVEVAWRQLFGLIKWARDEYQHSGFWTNVFGAGQGDGPFLMDLLMPGVGGVVLLRDARRALHIIKRLSETAGLGQILAAPTDPCDGCGADRFLEDPLAWR